MLADEEVGILLDDLYRLHGLDLRHFARAPLKLRLRAHLRDQGLGGIDELRAQLAEPASSLRLHAAVSPPTRPMFWDAQFHLALRGLALPLLRTYPSLNIWIPGCSTGEQVYALAIVLREEGLLERSHIYATEENDALLARARAGVYPGFTNEEADYLRAGGRASLSEYYLPEGGCAAMRTLLRDHVTFAQHSLSSDASFNEFQLILCRDVLLSFDRSLSARAFSLFHTSLCRFGVLALGRSETLRLHPQRVHYAALPGHAGLWRRMDP